ncbi:transporter [Carnobacterium sp. 17-4]|uniref:ABC transporter permease n=1 Tax=Carnobacterium sp. (strain 17-4) TaxID=208596 RepID=UPI0002059216|nr:transporter [Carnobacterium sp. 17-4]AEB29206.1 transporter [Carnobacterium sp. 17-4]
MVGQHFKGTGQIIRLLFQQNGVKIVLWLSGLIGVSIATVTAYTTIYTGQKEIIEFGLTMQNPAMIAMLGSLYEVDTFNLGAVFASEMLLFSAIAASVMNILLVSSSTRMDEEEGRLEMILALPVGRLAYLAATISMMVIVNSLLFMILSLGLGLFNHEAFSVESALLYGGILASTGLFFASVTAVTAQLAETSRGATGISFAVLITAYIIRAVGDVNNEMLSLVSPLGWTVRTAVFVDNDWWPVSALISGMAILLVSAFYLNQQRDINAGLLPERKGKVYASNVLKSRFGLTWRLEKGTIISWAIGVFLMSAAFGSILGDLEAYFSDFELVQVILGDDLSDSMTEQFITLLVGIMSVFAAVPAVSVLLKLKKEERLGRTENLYSRSVSRNKVMGSYYTIAFLTAVLMQLLIGLGLYASASQIIKTTIGVGTVIASGLVYIPAILVVLGLTTVLVGVFPKRTGLIWIYVTFAILVIYLGNLLEFPEWVNNISAFHHIPQLPNEEIAWSPLITLSLVGVGLTIIGFLGYNKRDI